MIRFQNTLSGKIEEFTPIKPSRVCMYHCGPTVYNYIHIGNLRSYVFADLLRRLFEYENYFVKQVINITDVGHLVSDADEGEDKILLGVRRENKSAKEVADFYTDAFMKDLRFLNIITQDTAFPRPTEYIPEQIDMIQKLEEKGFTYTISDGVYFDTSKFPDYGKLGNINLTGLEEGARVEINNEKRNPTDFALWKFSPTDGEKREQEWESPWGIGFPGWHIECSTMSQKLLGETFDLHTGGIDHIPIHHQNEIAQSESATGKKFVNYWLHHEHLKIDGTKISKSLGNQILLSEIIEKGISPLAYRYFLLSAHYRTPTNFTWEALGASENAYKRLKTLTRLLKDKSEGVGEVNDKYKKEFLSVLENDLNTPEALAVVWKLLKNAGDDLSYADAQATLLDFDRILGLKLEENESEVSDIPPEIKTLLQDRELARIAKNFSKADELRAAIEAHGYELKDTAEGQKLEKI